MVDVRAKAREFLDQLPPNVNVTSNGQTAALFTKLTGSTHDSLTKTWAKEEVAKAERRAQGKSTEGLPTTTTCNGLAVQLGQHIKAPLALGQFDIDKKLKAAGFQEAWIPANSGKRPGYGDVFRPVKFHMGVSLDFEGDMWNTAESGQGGPTAGFDMVKRKKTLWDPSTLIGWVDIEILMRLARKSPAWMTGWWQFEVDGRKEFVFLPERGAALRYKEAPKSVKLPPPAGGTTGEMDYADDLEGVTITWADGVVDSARHLPAVSYMLGERTGRQLQAFKMK